MERREVTFSESMLPLAPWSAVLPLCPESKANSRQQITVRGRTLWVLSAAARKFEKAATKLLKLQLPNPPIHPHEKLRLVCVIRYPDYRRDVDASLIEDVLQRAGVVPNDRQFRSKRYEAADETGDPEIRITIERVGVLPWKPAVKAEKF